MPDYSRYLVTDLTFPNECCRCSQPTQEQQTFFGSRSLLRQVLERILGWETFIEVSIPFCGSCAKKQRWDWLKQTLIGLAVSTGLALAGAVAFSRPGDRDPILPMMLAMVFLAGPVVGYFFGRKPEPVTLKNYAPSDGTVEVAFENKRFSASVASMSRSPVDGSALPS